MSLIDSADEQKEATLKARSVVAALAHIHGAQERNERFGDAEDLDVAEARLSNWLAEQPLYVTDALGVRLVTRLTRTQRREVGKLAAVYGTDPQAVGAEDGTEDDFGDLISEVVVALGYDPESDEEAWQRVQDVAARCDSEDLVEWASVLDLAWRADSRLRRDLVQTGEGTGPHWPR